MSCDDELIGEFVIEANEHLADIENQLLTIEESGDDIDVGLVNEVFRGVHSIKGAAGFLGLTKVNDLSHALENILNMMRNLELRPNSSIIDVMLRAADRLQGLINDIHNSNDENVSSHISALQTIADAATTSDTPSPAGDDQPKENSMEVNNTNEDTSSLSPQQQLEQVSLQEEVVLEQEPAGQSQAASEPSDTAELREKKTSSMATTQDATIRVSVGVLDKLMNLAGELVLGRNQLMQAVGSVDQSSLDTVASRLDQVTSELQESIMQTRMQPIGSVFAKFPRIVRDLSSKLGKHCALNIEGKEVEVDKTIIEAISDPLTHLIRNSVDHGIETPEGRKKAGKPAEGTMNLRAFYQAGKVRIEIEDDGAGIDTNKLKGKAVEKGIITREQAEQMSDREAVRLIFHPGFSMAANVTDVSGRGVGMDVVMTNISKLGGTVDVESVVGTGTNIVITLPLTLAIIPSLVVQCREDRFAIPQVNIAELVRLRAEERGKRVGKVKGAEVLRLRGNLLPLVRLEKSIEMTLSKDGEQDSQGKISREHGALNIIVVETGQQRFGVIVDGLHDSEEIVVKPLGRDLKDCPCLSGATILGDGHVALILDVAGIAAHEDIRSDDESDRDQAEQSGTQSNAEMQDVLLFNNHSNEHFAISMDVVSRIERVRSEQIDSVGGQELLQYRNTTMSLLRLENLIAAKPTEELDRFYVIVFEVAGREVGLIAPTLKDIQEVPTEVDTQTFRERGVLGSIVLGDQTTRMIDVYEAAEIAHPEWFERLEAVAKEDEQAPLILLAEDSTFFRNQVAEMIEERGYRVVGCEDGALAWEILNSGEHEFDLVVTDIEMPNMDGFELCLRIKQSSEWKNIPVIALTSLAGSADMQRGMDVGVDDYQVKMDRDRLLNAIHNFTGTKAGSHCGALQLS